MRLLAAAVLSLAALLASGAVPMAAGAAQTPAQEQAPPPAAPSPEVPSFRSASSELVVLPVVVRDRRGRLVRNIPREHFAIFDNGRRQTPTFFSDVDTPVSVAIVIDNSGSMREKLGPVIAGTLLFARRSHPDDELFAIEFNEQVRDATDGRSLRAEDVAALDAALRTLVPQGRTALYDAVMKGLGRLEQASYRRRVLVLMSDGGDNVSQATLDGVLARARAADVTIYTIGLFAPGDPDTNPGLLKRLAEMTGGERFIPKSPGVLLQVCDRIASEIRSGYTLGYVPPDRDGSFHRVRVEVGGPEGRRYDVRTRQGYHAGGAPSPRVTR